jgi:hypothetical protein
MKLGAFTAEAASERQILGLDGDPLGVNGGQVGVLEKRDEVGLAGLLKSQHSRGLETEVGLEVLSDFSDEPLERQLADQELSGLLVPSDFTECDSAWTEPVRFLDASGSRGRNTLVGPLGGKLLPWCLATSRLTSGLLCARHWV